MNENKNENTKPAGEKEKKELTPQQLQRRKKMIVFPLLFLLFVGSMWLIFAPKDGDKGEEQKDGFNTNLPTPGGSEIISDKRDAYMQEAMQNKRQDKMRSLQDFAFALGEDGGQESAAERAAREERMLRQSSELTSEAQSSNGNSSASRSNAFHSSATAYEDINRNLGSWYNEPATEVDEQAELELQWRVQELERKLQEKSEADEQLELIEKSYAIASRYMPTGGQTAPADAQPEVSASAVLRSGKPVAVPVTQVRSNVVSLLAAPIPDSVFVEEYSKERNWGFQTVAGSEAVETKNSINACVYKTVTLTDGQEVQIRILEAMRAGEVLLPANTIVTGTAQINGERMNITIGAVQHKGNVIPVELLVYDLDGGQGISVPGSEELNAIKEVVANMGTGMGSSITITDDAGSQLLADLGRSAIQGASSYVGKKMRTVKVTLKAGHRILLLPPLK